MTSVAAASLLAVQAYATQVGGAARPGPAQPPQRGADARAGGTAFSVELSKAATEALKAAGSSAAAPAGEAEFQPFQSAADMGARPAGQSAADFRREAPLRPAEPPVRHQRPGSQLDIKV